MKKTLSSAVSGAALAFAFIALSSGTTSTRADDGSQHRGSGVLEGTWVSTVSSAPGQTTPFLSMVTYTPTGQSFEENNTPQIRSVGHGEWVRIGPGKFQRTMLIFNFLPLTDTGGARTYSGVTRVDSAITLERGGESYNAINTFNVYNPSGQLVTTGQNTSHANRCGFDVRVPVCLGIETAARR